MFDTSRALADMASQIRAARCADGLTLQQLATRSGVAASTIHKVEAQQMVPTVSVLLKISKGLGCRPEELIRDGDEDETSGNGVDPSASSSNASNGGMARKPDAPHAPDGASLPAHRELRVWKLALSMSQSLPDLAIDHGQLVILLVEAGSLDLEVGPQRISLSQGDCVEVEGSGLRATVGADGPARLTLIGALPAAENG